MTIALVNHGIKKRVDKNSLTKVPLLEKSCTVITDFVVSLPSQRILQCLLPNENRVNGRDQDNIP